MSAPPKDAAAAAELALMHALVLAIARCLPTDRALAALELLARFVRVWAGASAAWGLVVPSAGDSPPPPTLSETGAAREVCDAAKLSVYYAGRLLDESVDASACRAMLGALFDCDPVVLLECFGDADLRHMAHARLRLLHDVSREIRGTSLVPRG